MAMNENKRPWPVIVIASLYLLVGVIGFVAHFPELWARHPDAVGIELTELVGAISGVGLLMRQKWARWLALAWILFHVGLSLFHPIGELAIHRIPGRVRTQWYIALHAGHAFGGEPFARNRRVIAAMLGAEGGAGFLRRRERIESFVDPVLQYPLKSGLYVLGLEILHAMPVLLAVAGII